MSIGHWNKEAVPIKHGWLGACVRAAAHVTSDLGKAGPKRGQCKGCRRCAKNKLRVGNAGNAVGLLQTCSVLSPPPTRAPMAARAVIMHQRRWTCRGRRHQASACCRRPVFGQRPQDPGRFRVHNKPTPNPQIRTTNLKGNFVCLQGKSSLQHQDSWHRSWYESGTSPVLGTGA